MKDFHDVELVLYEAGLTPQEFGFWIDPDETVGALVASGHVVVGWISLEWRHVAPPPDFILKGASHLVAPIDPRRLRKAIKRARARGIARLQTCRFCEQRFNPGWMHNDEVCQGCAERHLRVVH